MKNLTELYGTHLFVILITWLWVNFDPLQSWLIDIFDKVLADNLFFRTLYELITCWKCLVFWVSVCTFGFGLESLIITFSVHNYQLIENFLSKK